MNDTTENQPTKQELIERRIDRDVASTVNVGTTIGGLRVTNMLEVMEISKLMSVSGQAVPVHLRNNPGMCLAVALQAIEWNMSPFSVANKSYVTNDRLNYESQLIHAVVEARAPLRERLQCRYEGEGEDRVCIVWGTFKGEVKPREHKSPPLKQVRPPMGDRGIKGSPLWAKKPDVQLFYDTSRDFCRIYCPDVLLGVYTRDEVEQYGIGEEARDVTPAAPESAALAERLQAHPAGPGPREGYEPGAVERALPAESTPKEPKEPKEAKRKAGRPRTPPPEKPESTLRASGGAAGGGTGTIAGGSGGGGPGSGTAILQGGEVVSVTLENQPGNSDTISGNAPASGTISAAAEPSTMPARRQPTDLRQYADWIDDWLPQCKTEEEVIARWKDEIPLRNRCGIVEEERKAIYIWVEDRIAELRRAT